APRPARPRHPDLRARARDRRVEVAPAPVADGDARAEGVAFERREQHVERAAPRLRARPRRWGRAPLLPREPQRAAAVARQCDVAVLQRAARERVRRLEALLVATREKELPDA